MAWPEDGTAVITMATPAKVEEALAAALDPG